MSFIPLALALGYVAWRTGSVLPGVAAHLSYSLIGGTLTLVTFFRPDLVVSIPLWLAAAGTAVALIGLVLVRANTRRPSVAERSAGCQSVVRRWWPALVAFVVFVAVAGLELVASTGPSLLAAGETIDLGDPPWESEMGWRYEIRNAADEQVGAAECSVTPEGEAWVLDCEAQQEAYEVRTSAGFFSEAGVAQRMRAQWDAALMLRSVDLTVTITSQVSVEARVRVAEEGLSLTVTASGEQVDGLQLPSDVLIAGSGARSPLMVGEWLWRLSALPFEVAYSRETTVAWPYRSVEGVEGRVPYREAIAITVRTAERFFTPAGSFIAWRVESADRLTAWFDVESPHTLLGYQDGLLSWKLIETG